MNSLALAVFRQRLPHKLSISVVLSGRLCPLIQLCHLPQQLHRGQVALLRLTQQGLAKLRQRLGYPLADKRMTGISPRCPR